MYPRCMALVELKNVSKSYPRRVGLRSELRAVVEDVSFTIEAGETWASSANRAPAKPP
jgi:ABC-type oligopeptide transport system ATPase subunit